MVFNYKELMTDTGISIKGYARFIFYFPPIPPDDLKGSTTISHVKVRTRDGF
jgi:hypothetical protein